MRQEHPGRSVEHEQRDDRRGVGEREQRRRTRRRRSAGRSAPRACACPPDVGRTIAHVVDDEDRGRDRARPAPPPATRARAPRRAARSRAAHRDEAEEHHHEDVAEPVVAERPRPAGVGDARRAPRARRSITIGQPPTRAGSTPTAIGERDASRSCPRAPARGVSSPACTARVGPRRSCGVGALLGVEHVVGEVGRRSGSQGADERRERRAPRESRPPRTRPRCRTSTGTTAAVSVAGDSRDPRSTIPAARRPLRAPRSRRRLTAAAGTS